MMTLSEKFDFQKACEYIKGTAVYGSRPGLGRIRSLCGILGNPQDELSFIHIAGTNGKGSTAAMISSVLSEARLRVGMYYSPAMTGISDHYMAGGLPIAEEEYAEAVREAAAANEKLKCDTGESATQFEIETAVAFLYFKSKCCDVVVMETGMGGTEDATNIVRNKLCCVITSVSCDHMQYLGNTLREIAAAKAGIITSPCPVITVEASDTVTTVIKERCAVTGSRLYTVKPAAISPKSGSIGELTVSCCGIDDVTISLGGTFQAENAALAIQTVKVLGENHLLQNHAITEAVIRAGLIKVKWPYRFQCICNEPLIIVDGAHNEDATQKLAESVRNVLYGRYIIFVLGVFSDKEYEKIVRILSDVGDMFITVETPDNPRALPAKSLAECVRMYCENAAAADSIGAAYDMALSEAGRHRKARAAVIACGSLSYLDEFVKYGKS